MGSWDPFGGSQPRTSFPRLEEWQLHSSGGGRNLGQGQGARTWGSSGRLHVERSGPGRAIPRAEVRSAGERGQGQPRNLPLPLRSSPRRVAGTSPSFWPLLGLLPFLPRVSAQSPQGSPGRDTHISISRVKDMGCGGTAWSLPGEGVQDPRQCEAPLTLPLLAGSCLGQDAVDSLS